jgi:hypothetical protein
MYGFRTIFTLTAIISLNVINQLIFVIVKCWYGAEVYLWNVGKLLRYNRAQHLNFEALLIFVSCLTYLSRFP